MGNQALSSGQGELAYEYYSQAQKLGASRPFNTVNRSMACIIARDFSGAKIQIENFRILRGTPMEINVRALQCLVAGFERDTDYSSMKERLKGLVSAKQDFQFDLSPLKHLREGIPKSKLDASAQAVADEVFSCLA